MAQVLRKEKKVWAEAGLTLIECLVAISVIALTVATIAPMLVFSVATRVQNQKTEQALQLARAEVDKVRLVVEQGGDYGDTLSNDLLVFSDPIASTASDVAAPTAFESDTTNVTVVTDARLIDSDGDSEFDFAVQLFRTEGIEVASGTPGAASTPVIFEVGVRVYDARAESNLGALLTDEAPLTFTSGDGERGNRPLAVLYSQIAQGDRPGSLCEYWEFAGSSPTSLSCN